MGAKGASTQASGPSRGGQATKIHLLTAIVGRPAVVHITLGNASDVRTAPDVLAQVPSRMRRLIADGGYDANRLRADLRASGTKLVIHGTLSRMRPIQYDRRRHRDR